MLLETTSTKKAGMRQTSVRAEDHPNGAATAEFWSFLSMQIDRFDLIRKPLSLRKSWKAH